MYKSYISVKLLKISILIGFSLSFTALYMVWEFDYDFVHNFYEITTKKSFYTIFFIAQFGLIFSVLTFMALSVLSFVVRKLKKCRWMFFIRGRKG